MDGCLIAIQKPMHWGKDVDAQQMIILEKEFGMNNLS